MDNILLNPLNKKILILVVVVFFVGLLTTGFRHSPGSHQKVYMYEDKKQNLEKIVDDETLEYTSPLDIEFLPLHQVEEELQRREYQTLYVDADPNFGQKVQNIENYMGRRNTPLKDEAHYITMIANKYGIDYRLVPAISIIESSGGLKLYRKYNAWGWGGASGFTFENWEHSIYVVSRGLGGYYSMGLDTPKKMAPRYNPHTPNEWGAKVEMVMNQIGPKL